MIKSFIAHNDSVTSLALNPKYPNQVISVSHDGSLRIWDLRKYQCLQELAVKPFLKMKKLLFYIDP